MLGLFSDLMKFTVVNESLSISNQMFCIENYSTILKLNKFAWSNKKHFFKREILYDPKDIGGLDMINLECLFRAVELNWIKDNL